MQPGYLPMKPNGDPMFRGSQFNSRINGGQTMATENFFDGAAFGYAVGHQQSQESAPPVEAIQEVKVITTTYSAQYGHTSGGFIEYTSKSGTNTLHGSVYEYFARRRAQRQGLLRRSAKTPLKQQQLRRHAGRARRHPEGVRRPQQDVLLHQLRLDAGSAPACCPGFGNTTPIDAFKDGDFSALLTGTQIGTDALGRPIFGGQIFNPATTRLVNGVPVRDPYPGQHHSRRTIRCAARWRPGSSPLMVRPDRAGTSQQRRGQSRGRPDVGTGRAEPPGPPGPQLHAEFQGRASASTGTAGPRSATAARSAAARPSSMASSSRRRTTPTTATGSTSASRRITPTSSSTGSSATTC